MGANPVVDIVIEAAIDANRLRDARGPHRDVAAVVARDAVAGRGHRQACQRSPLDGRAAGLPARAGPADAVSRHRAATTTPMHVLERKQPPRSRTILNDGDRSAAAATQRTYPELCHGAKPVIAAELEVGTEGRRLVVGGWQLVVRPVRRSAQRSGALTGPVPYRVDVSHPPGDALDRRPTLGALDIEPSGDGLAAILPDGVTPAAVAAALGVVRVAASEAVGRDDESVWILSPRASVLEVC